MWWLFTKKVQKHSAIEPDETVYQACYGLGGKIVQVANRAISPTSDTWTQPETSEGLASPIDRSGVVALTSKRLLFFAKRFAIGQPGSISAEWALNLIEEITYDDDTLQITFTDQSAAELHVPKNQSPQKLIAALETIRRSPAS